MYKLLRKKHENDDNDFFSPWIDHVKSWLSEMGMLDFWMYECMGFSKDYIKSAVKLRISDMHLQQWNVEVNENTACDYYRKIKENHVFEKYLTELGYKNRCIVSQFRSRSNFLPVHMTKFDGISVDDIACPFCNISPCDEAHMLKDCTFFSVQRNLLEFRH